MCSRAGAALNLRRRTAVGSYLVIYCRAAWLAAHQLFQNATLLSFTPECAIVSSVRHFHSPAAGSCEPIGTLLANIDKPSTPHSRSAGSELSKSCAKTGSACFVCILAKAVAAARRNSPLLEASLANCPNELTAAGSAFLNRNLSPSKVWGATAAVRILPLATRRERAVVSPFARSTWSPAAANCEEEPADQR